MADRRLLTSRQIKALEAGRVLALPPSIDLKGSRMVPLGGHSVDRADEKGDDPVRALVLRFGADAAVLLLEHARHVLKVLDGEPAVSKGLAKDLGDGLYALPVPPEPDAALVFLYVHYNKRMFLLGGYAVDDDRAAIDAARADASARRPDRLTW
jgi:hypothetical protein